MKPVVGGAAPWHGLLVGQSDKITAFMMERGRKAFEAITDNQNSTEPRRRGNHSNGEGGEGGDGETQSAGRVRVEVFL